MTENLESLSTDKVENRIAQVVGEMANIRMQLDMAKSDSVSGIYSDSVWFRTASFALRKKGAEHQALLKELGKRKAAQRQANAKRFERLFVDEARRMLPPETYSEIREAAFHLMAIEPEAPK